MTESIEYEFDLSIYRIEAVKKAAYRFSGRFDVQLRPIDGNRVCVTLHPKSEADIESPNASDFPNEVLDQELRESVSQETEGVRNLLLAQAFSSLTLVDPIGDTAEFDDDPLNIGLDPSESLNSSRAPTDSTPTEDHRSP